MKKEIADKWVAALKSGKYEQSRLRLKTSEGYCCLGVLCDISGLGKWEVDERGIDKIVYKYVKENDTAETALLSSTVTDWAGMINHAGQLPIEVIGVKYLFQLNDSGKMNFNQIADIIEKHYESI